MKVEVRPPDTKSFEADVVAVGFPANGTALSALDQGLARRLTDVAEEEDVAGAIGRTAVLHPDGDAPARRLIAVGLGAADELDADAIRTAAARVASAAERVGGSLAWLLDDSLALPPAEQARAIVDGLLLRGYHPGRWKRDAKELPFDRLVLIGPPEAQAAAQRAGTLAQAGNPARDPANT